ncbi:putative lipid II flippase FtsW [Kangiella koreensis]|uniref:Probable peptidoglycan glycosyltransferase FtsW n=1 Tax=Kangiella koreensis (strain DSM 16069 / JCM 12317 / KCTC 12182 / SW-125) TaxID=523791 RepID=C7R9L7_KANKD|nr:putative lipid II flippase FtsW [Kangiella koreensis]ACV26108.1 cell division protein FtsW [Kangiella koreensis DSM 16069]
MTSILKTLRVSDFIEQLKLSDRRTRLDPWLLGPVMILLAIGVMMVASSSMPFAEDHMNGNEFHFLIRHIIYLSIALVAAMLVLQLDTRFWQVNGIYMLLFGIVLLMLVLVIGREVNGSKRWIGIGPMTVQPAELMKFFIVTYLAGYLVRRSDELQTQIKGFTKPLLVIGLVVAFLLLQPDFGSSAVIVATALAMLFLAGAKLWQFISLTAFVGVVMALVAWKEPYRMKRLTSFLDPWADQFGSGYQLVQSLIAFGRGDWFGVGLGNSVQKLSYLPEAHTDFVFAVFAEEFGFIGVLLVITLFAIILLRSLSIGRRALKMEQYFAAYVTYGFGFWLSLQALINIGVSSGSLPTKGLTLPFISYGGNSLIVTCMAIAIILRVDFEVRRREHEFAKVKRAYRSAKGGQNDE